jgi:predicted amidophosphoribosyltransferase
MPDYRLLESKDYNHVCSDCGRDIDKKFHYLLWCQKTYCLNCGLYMLKDHLQYYKKYIKELNEMVVLITQLHKERIVQKLKGDKD